MFSMIEKKYLVELQEMVEHFFANRQFVDVFVYGSSLVKDVFGDVDIALRGAVNEHDVARLKEMFADTTFPYTVDVVDLNKASEAFASNIFKQKTLCLLKH